VGRGVLFRCFSLFTAPSIVGGTDTSLFPNSRKMPELSFGDDATATAAHPGKVFPYRQFLDLQPLRPVIAVRSQTKVLAGFFVADKCFGLRDERKILSKESVLAGWVPYKAPNSHCDLAGILTQKPALLKYFRQLSGFRF